MRGMRSRSFPWRTGPATCALTRAVWAQLLLSTFIGCTVAPCTPPPPPSPVHATEAPDRAAPTLSLSSRASSPKSTPTPSPAPPPARALIDRNNTYYFVEFPTSVSHDGTRIAAMISIESGDPFTPEWLVIKDLENDEVEETIDLIDPVLSSWLIQHCREDVSPCVVHVERRVQAANAAVETERWRPFPCFSVRGSERRERMGPGCDILEELRFEYKDPRLIISRGGRPVVTRTLPRWSPKYRKPKCNGITIDTYVESVAFDPATGLFVISLRFVGPEGNFECPTPRWDFHPIRLPMYRREDGGAPVPAPERDAGGS